MNIDEMPAGRELNKLVAEKVMGWHVSRMYATPEYWDPSKHDSIHYSCDEPDAVPDYSNDGGAALKVIKRLDESLGAWFEIRGPRGWVAQCNCPGRQYTAAASTMSLAVCRVALKVIKDPSGHNTKPIPNLTTAILSSLPGALQGKVEGSSR